jgi:hypothetical protein
MVFTKKLDFVDLKSEGEGSSESPKKSPPQSPRENQLPPMGEQPPQEHKIGELCTPDNVDLPILNLCGDRKAVPDQDLNNQHGATFTLCR